ncbi:MAG: serine hydrolase domain-containing protein [Caldimonas sp.]
MTRRREPFGSTRCEPITASGGRHGGWRRLACAGIFAIGSALGVCAQPVASTSQACAPPPVLTDTWTTQSAGDAGFDAEALCALLVSVQGGQANVHGLLIARRGKLVAELYRPGPDHPINRLYGLWGQDTAFDAGTPHDVRSISKSVVSLLFGVARGKGLIAPPSTAVLDVFPDLDDLRTPQLAAIQLQHLLSMSSGLAWSEGSPPDNETRLFWNSRPDRYVLDRKVVTAPGQRFNYNSGGTSLIAQALVRAEGAPLPELARQQLFEPMGIKDWEWVADLHGRALAFTGLRLRPRDLLKFGKLVLDKGRWQGRQLVPADWIEDSTRAHIQTGFKSPILPDEEIGYGYQWWTGHVPWHGQRLTWSAAFGNGGQRLFVLPDLDLAMVVTAGGYNSSSIDPLVLRLWASVVASVQR